MPPNKVGPQAVTPGDTDTNTATATATIERSGETRYGTAYDRIITALEGHGCTVNTNGHHKAQAQCPAHDDTRPSLSITATEGRTLVHCHAGCDPKDVLAATGLTLADLYDEPFDHPRYGQVLAKYVYPDQRLVLRTADKQFPQPNRDKNKGRSLFHADRIGDATNVYVTEGEEDTYAVEAAGGVAVSAAMGAGKADRFDWTVLRGKNIRIIADKDDAGYKHAQQVADQLDSIATSVRILLPAIGKDASDHIAAGKTLAELAPFKQPSVLDRLAVNGTALDAEVFAELEFAVDGIICEGVGMLVGPPKIGKSWLVGNIGLTVAAGDLALGAITVEQRPVLYLALEDGKRRLQNRSRTILKGQPIPAKIDFITDASPNEALISATEFAERHRDEKPLIIIDTLGKIKRQKHPGEEAYLVDYEIGTKLKQLASIAPGSTVLVVHHTRKAEAADFIDSVSGTHGLAGSVDFVLVLSRKRLSDDAVLAVTGRDICEAEYALHADDGILWRLDGTNLTAASDTVDQRRAAERVGDRMMDVYLEVRAAKGRPISAIEIAGLLDDLDNNTAGTYLRRLAASGYINKRGRGLYVVSEVSETARTPSSDAEKDSNTRTPTLSEVSETTPAVPPHSDTPDSSSNSDTSDTSDRSRTDRPHCGCECGCDGELSATVSVERRYCERCHLTCKRRQGQS